MLILTVEKETCDIQKQKSFNKFILALIFFVVQEKLRFSNKISENYVWGSKQLYIKEALYSNLYSLQNNIFH